jgi:hydroxymethylbilane synthase
MRKIVIGTRGSALALIQARIVRDALQKIFPDRKFLIKEIKTTGDIITDIPLEKIGDKGLFIKELETALLDKEIDLAVHSMKDLPTALPAGLKIGAIMTREKPWDVVIGGRPNQTLGDLNKGARIGSSSLRRRAQLLHHYPHLDIQPIRGNLDTRLGKLRSGDFEAIILAYAGVKRMGWCDQITEIISGDLCLPAVGQGAIGIEIRKEDAEVSAMVSGLNNPQTEAAVTAERSFLKRLEGGCQVPIGALAEVSGRELILEGMVASPDGAVLFRETEKGKITEADAVGTALAERLLQQGCGEILELIRRECL